MLKVRFDISDGWKKHDEILLQILELYGRSADVCVLVVPFDLGQIDGRVAAAEQFPLIIVERNNLTGKLAASQCLPD